MHHLWTVSRKIKESIEGGAHLLLSLNFDAALASIVGNPWETFLPARTRNILESLNQKTWCTIAILSGRQLDNLVDRVGIEGIIYGGNHGVQLSGPGIDFQAPLPVAAIDALKTIACRLELLNSSVDGVFLENKGSSLSVHYRNVAPSLASTVPELVKGIMRPFQDVGLVKAYQGQEVIEITTDFWDKARAVTWLMEQVGCQNGHKRKLVTVYVGNNTTDEDAFSVVRENGYAVLVGKKKVSRASYFLKNRDEVYSFLMILDAAKQ